MALYVVATLAAKAGTAVSGLAKVGGLLGGGAVASVLKQSIGGAIAGMASILDMLALALLVVGIFHAYVLPMLPYIQFLFFVMGMLILVCEGMVAAPLWAFMHVSMDGSEFVDGKQEAGYIILFNLFLRIPFAMCHPVVLAHHKPAGAGGALVRRRR